MNLLSKISPRSSMRRSRALGLLMFLSLLSTAQVMFEKTYSNFTRIRKFAVTSDGGTIVSGKSAYLGNDDMAMLKLDANGNVQWAHAYGSGVDDDQAEGVIQTLDGGYLLVGSTGTNCYTVKTNSLGVLQWQATHTPGSSRRATDVTQLPDSSYIITVAGGILSSTSSSDAGYMKLDKAGNLLWAKSYGSVGWTCCTYNPHLYKVLPINTSGSMLLIGSTMSGSSATPYLRKVDRSGTKLFEKGFNGAGFGFYFTGIQTADANIVVAGYSMAAKIDTSGNVIWMKEYAANSGSAMIQGISELPNGNLVFYEIHSDGYPHLLETTSLGVPVRSVRLNGINDIYERNYNMCTMVSPPDGSLEIGFTNKVKKIPAAITLACSSASGYTFTATSKTPTVLNPNVLMPSSSSSPVKTFVDGTVSVVATSVCSSTYCAAVAQPAAISGPAALCDGATGTYSVPLVSGASSYTWSLPGGWTGSSSTNQITVTAGSAGGVLSVSAVSSCSTSSASTLTVTVNPSATTPGAISGPSVLCAGSTATYSVAPVSGATSYSWTAIGGWTGSSTSNTISLTAGATGGNLSVSAVNMCGASAAQTQSVSVQDIPAQPSAIAGNSNPCAGSTVVYSVTPVSGATAYTWTLPGGWSGTSSTYSISATAASSGGTLSVNASNSCGTSPGQDVVLSTASAPAMPSAISGNTLVCPSSALVYSVTPVSGAIAYSWSLPGGWTGSGTSYSIAVSAGASGGNITVAAVNACGSSGLQVQTVSMAALPTVPGPISGSAVFCPGASLSYSISAVSGASSYSWSLPGGWSGSSASNTITLTAGTSPGTIGVASINGCGSSASQTLAVSLGSAPPMPAAIMGTATVCAGSSNTYSVSPVAGASSYVWTLPAGWSGSGSSNSISATSGSTGGNIQVTASNGCGSSAAQSFSVNVTGVPSQPSAINGYTAACTGASSAYSVTAVPGAVSYSWLLPSGFSGSSTSNVIIATAGGVGGAIQVTANNACGSSALQSIAVLVNPLPNVQASGSHTLICTGETATLTANGASTYAWSTGASTQSISVNPVTTTNYTVTGTSASGCVNTATLALQVSACTSVQEMALDGIRVYPNPAASLLTIEAIGQWQLSLTNAFGQSVLEPVSFSNRFQLDISNQAAGIYVIRLEGLGTSRLLRVIKN